MAKLQVKDAFDLQIGKTPSRKRLDYWTDGTFDWVSIRDLGTYDRYVGSTKERITQLAVEESGIKPVPPNTLIMSFKLSLGKTAITVEPTYTNEAIMAFIDKGTYPVDLGYMFHQLRTKDWTEGTNRAVMGATLNKKSLSESWILLPPEDEQHEAADALDSVIEKLARVRMFQAKLDQLVKSRFVEMFGNLKSNEYGWPTSSMERVTLGINDGEHGKIVRSEEGPLLLSARSVGVDGLDYDSAAHVPQDEFERISKRFSPVAGDVVLTCAGTIGRAAMVGNIPFVSDRDVALIKPDTQAVIGDYLLHYFKSDDALDQMGQLTHKATISHLYLGKIRQMRLLVPPLDLQLEFAAFVQQVDKLKLITQQQIEKLQMLYDSLAQEYFSI